MTIIWNPSLEHVIVGLNKSNAIHVRVVGGLIKDRKCHVDFAKVQQEV